MATGSIPVGHETAIRDENTEPVNRWQAMPGREHDDEIAMDNS
jgi:hypothetical protein